MRPKKKQTILNVTVAVYAAHCLLVKVAEIYAEKEARRLIALYGDALIGSEPLSEKVNIAPMCCLCQKHMKAAHITRSKKSTV